MLYRGLITSCSGGGGCHLSSLVFFSIFVTIIFSRLERSIFLHHFNICRVFSPRARIEIGTKKMDPKTVPWKGIKTKTFKPRLDYGCYKSFSASCYSGWWLSFFFVSIFVLFVSRFWKIDHPVSFFHFFHVFQGPKKIGVRNRYLKGANMGKFFLQKQPPKKKKKTHTHRHFEVSRNNAFVNCKNETFYFIHPPKKKTRLRDREWNNHVKIFRVSQKTRILMVQFLCACYFDDIVLIRVHASMVPHQRDDTKLFVTLRHLPTSTTCL